MFEYWAILLIGFFSSFGHCVGMCGGFVTAYTMKLQSNQSLTIQGRWYTALPHLFYNLGRVITYSILGLLFGFAGEALKIIGDIRFFQGFLQLVAGILMILIALEIGGWIPTLFSDKMPGYHFIKKQLSQLFRKLNRQNIFFLGILNGLIPCGLVYAAGAKAASTASPLEGLLTMLFFGLGTIPAMLLIGIASNFISINVRKRIFKFAVILVGLLGFITFYKGLSNLYSPPPVHWHHLHQS
ncbi:MAG: sulfite exporter TauE/SafE family protein [Calditrichaeota bacterium]|nr:MAG: sulfite exporter TauE/SafE family protein [Calditrichota bacterium]